MSLLASMRWRIFLTTWILYTAHFATNIVREHYPAFSIVDNFSFRVDEYQGFHSDIFQHRDGHSQINNNVAVSVLVAAPLFVFDPFLDALERHSKKKLATETAPTYTTYRALPHHRNSKAFFRLAKEQGLELRFGGVAFVTAAFLIAPLSALTVVMLFQILILRGSSERRATWLALLFAFGTPIFFRSASLSHNLFLMYAAFLSFYLLWNPAGTSREITRTRVLAAGFLGGFTLAADYSGVVLILALYSYYLFSRVQTAGWSRGFRESLVFVCGSIPPVAFLFYSQWAMYGHPFLPGQFWMPAVNFTDRGWRGISIPTLDLYFLSLFSPSYGFYSFGPLLLLGLVPIRWYKGQKLLLPQRERRFVSLFFLAFLTFHAANQYSRMQFNTGLRYLMPLVPFVFLMLCDHLARMPKKLLIWVASLAVLHTWVLTAFRESVPLSWRLFVENGVRLPWLYVIRQTLPEGAPIVSNPFLPMVLLGGVLTLIGILWRGGFIAEGRPSGDQKHVDASADEN